MYERFQKLRIEGEHVEVAAEASRGVRFAVGVCGMQIAG